MGQEEPKKEETQAASVPVPDDQTPAKQEKGAQVSVVPDLDKTLAPAPEKNGADPEKTPKGSAARDAGLAIIETEKRNALIKAWEENEKAKIENKTYKNISAIGSWESAKKASAEAKIKKYEEKIERKKAEYAEKMKNKIAEIHKMAEEKKVMIEAKRGEDCLKIEETAAKYRSTGYEPKKFYSWFTSY
ncbi:hypothetical protein Tsubulata_010273 [Turnera subulata]|uniref:Remorin C-terminal domain-containing protein n=1 Tax=Turnera subulata TaxID=218843 RepID=A0A9Q0FKH9_9ROSI|nr:hypothetical protein Tsubulata_010273 [Turnera subulata]